jgi:hypothetical protein
VGSNDRDTSRVRASQFPTLILRRAIPWCEISFCISEVECWFGPLAPEALTVHEPGRFTVHLPALTSDRRDRFTIAHELGHYFLHYLLPGKTGEMKFGRGSRNRPETEANIFGASLLMPTGAYKKAFEEFGDDWWQLGELFGVSPRSAEVRAEVLGLRRA